MKKIILLILTIFISGNIGAQDTIYKKSGITLLSKITEITPTEIKYKKFDFQDGPTYVENKKDVSEIHYQSGLKERIESTSAITESIKEPVIDYYGQPQKPTYNAYQKDKIGVFGNRYLYNSLPISERGVHDLLMRTNDKQIINLVQQSKEAHGLQFVGFGGIALGIGAYVFLIESLTTSSTNSNGSSHVNENYLAGAGICALAAIACPIVSGVFKQNRMRYNREAIRIYNEKY